MFRAAREFFASPSDSASKASENLPVVEPLESRTMLNAAWTVLVYMAADNDLESTALADINEMERVGSTIDVNIIVQADLKTAMEGKTYIGPVARDQNPDEISSQPFPMGEVNMGDPLSLTRFLSWGVERFPSDHYAVILWNHGGGIDGVCWDVTDGKDCLTLDEIAQAFRDVDLYLSAEAQARFDHFDLIGFDACLMGMLETAYEVAPYADVMVASEATEPRTRWAYHDFLQSLVSLPSMNAAQLGSRIVSSYGNYYKLSQNNDPKIQETLSAIDLNRLCCDPVNFTDSLDAFVRETVQNATPSDYLRMQHHRKAADYFYQDSYRDLGEFLQGVAGDTAITASVRAAAGNALRMYRSAVIANYAEAGSDATGLSVYLPVSDAEVGAGSMYLHSDIDLVDWTYWGLFQDWWDDMQARGLVDGWVYDDRNCDGQQQGDENFGAAGAGVYLDADGNGQYDGQTTDTYRHTAAIPLEAITTSTLTVSGSSDTILDVDVMLYTTRTNLKDYTFTLISPTGQRVVLSRAFNGDASSWDHTIFDDEAEIPLQSSLAEIPYRGSFKPLGDLGRFDGYLAEGDWTLEIVDTSGHGGGVLREWSLTITTGEPMVDTWASDGGFVFSVLPGNYTVGLLDEYGDWFDTASPQALVVSSGQVVPVTMPAAYTGTVTGTVRTFDGTTETPAEGWYVYADDNKSGCWDEGEAWTFTEADGSYVLTGLRPGMPHRIAAILEDGYRVLPPLGGFYDLDFSLSDTRYDGIDFLFQGPWIYGLTDSYFVAEDGVLNDFLRGDDPRWGDPFRFEILVQPSHGTLTLDSDTGAFTYTPEADFNGVDVFSFQCVSQAHSWYYSDPAFAYLVVEAGNDAPVRLQAETEVKNFQEDVWGDLELYHYFFDTEAALLYGPEGSKYLSYELDPNNLPQHGTVDIRVDEITGQVSCYYRNEDRYSQGTDSFRIRVVDLGDPIGTGAGVLTSEYLTVHVNILPQDDAPVCEDQYLTVAYDGNPIEILLRGQDEETPAEQLRYTLAARPVDAQGNPAGRVDLQGNRATYYFSEYRYWENRTVEFTYQVTDSDGVSSQARVFLTLTPPEGQFVLLADGVSAQYRDEDGSLVTVRIKGGSAMLFFAGEDISTPLIRRGVHSIMGGGTRLYDIQLLSSSPRTSVSITVQGGDGRTTLGSLRGDAVLGQFLGRSVDLMGYGVEMTGNGYIRNLQMGDVRRGADIRMEGAGQGMTMALGAIDLETNIVLNAPLRSFSAVQWTGGAFFAPSVGTFRVSGTLSGNITVGRAAEFPPRGEGGEEEELLAVGGASIGSFYAGSIRGAEIRTSGGIGTLQTGNWLGGSLQSEWLGLLKVTGGRGNPAAGLFDADVTLKGNWKGYSLGSANIAGRILGGTWSLAGSVQTLRAGGTEAPWTADLAGGIGSLLSSGRLDGTLTLGGSLQLLQVAGTFAADLAVNGWDARGLSVGRLLAGRADGGRLTAAGGVGRVQAGEWLGGQIRSRYVDVLQTTGRGGLSGDLSADIFLTGQNAHGLALGLCRVAGDWSGTLNNSGPGQIGPFYENGQLVIP